MYYFSLFLFLFSSLSCSNNSSVRSETESYALVDTIPIDSKILYSYTKFTSGQYGFLNIAIDSTKLTGCYAYYSNYSDEYKEYLNICTFVFKGEITDSVVAITSLEYDEPGNGTLTLKPNNVIEIKLSEQPNGYGAYDFESGYTDSLSEKTNWRRITSIIVEKSFLYSKPDSTEKKRRYLIMGNIVNVGKTKNGWLEITYFPPNSVKPIRGWIKDEDVF